MKQLLTVQELSELIKLKVPTIYKLVCCKKIPYIKLGSALRFNPDQIEEWVNLRMIEPLNKQEITECWRLNYSDDYIKGLLCNALKLKPEDVPPEMVDLYRTTVLIKREIKKSKLKVLS